MGFETIDRADRALVSILGVNLPRWGLKLRLEATNVRAIGACVNLPRWGLKQMGIPLRCFWLVLCKFTPLGFETRLLSRGSHRRLLCKFTPLGFETKLFRLALSQIKSVNLPRWGLKRSCFLFLFVNEFSVNLPRWGLKPGMYLSGINTGLGVNLPRWGLKQTFVFLVSDKGRKV